LRTNLTALLDSSRACLAFLALGCATLDLGVVVLDVLDLDFTDLDEFALGLVLGSCLALIEVFVGFLFETRGFDDL
jgi:hypothetical protein